MSFAIGTKKDTMNFHGIPLYVKEEIMKKMTFMNYVKFTRTCKMAEALDSRNKNSLYLMDADKIMICKDYIQLYHGYRVICFSFEHCEKMVFSPAEVDIYDIMEFNDKTWKFMQKISAIGTLRFYFLNYMDLDVKEFLKTTKINKLMLTTVRLQQEVDSFPYDTSNIDQLEIDNCCWLQHFDLLSSIKAGRHLRLNTASLDAHQILKYIKEMTSRIEPMVDLTLSRYCIENFDYFWRFIKNECTPSDNGDWSFTKEHETKPFMTIYMSCSEIQLKGC